MVKNPHQKMSTQAFLKVTFLRALLILININELFGNLSNTAKLFADDASLFNLVHVINTSANKLNNNFKKMSNWAFQCKMKFNPDPSKQAQEVSFSRKLENILHPHLVFNNANVNLTNP